MSEPSVARNAVLLISGTTIQKIIAFVSFTLIARWVGVEVTGQYFFAISVTSVFVTLTDLGMTPVLIRATAQKTKDARELFHKVFQAKAMLIPIAVACSLVYGWWSEASSVVLLAMAIATGVLSLDALTLTWYGWLRGHRDVKPEATGMLITQLVTAIAGLIVARLGFGPAGLAGALLLGSAVNAYWSHRCAKRLATDAYDMTHEWTWKRLAKSALPFALAGVFVKMYSYADTLFLQAYWSDREVGLYAVAYKLTYAFQFVPLAFVGALYPGMSSAFAENKEALTTMFRASLRLMAGVAIPLSVWLSWFAPTIIQWLYGRAYDGSVSVLRVLPWVLIPIFLDFPVGSLLNASHRAHLKTASMGIAMIVNVLANALFVPRLGPVGGAVSGVLSFSLLTIIGLWFVREQLHDWGMRFFVRIALSTIALALVGSWLATCSPVLGLGLAFVATCAMWAVSGLVEPSELERILAKLQSLRSRL